MDEDTKKIEENTIDSKLKEAISDELNTFINPKIGKSQTNDAVLPPPVSNQSSAHLGDIDRLISVKEQGGVEIPRKPVVRTYKSDVEETIQAGHLSSVSIAMSQNARMLKGLDTSLEEIRKKKTNKNILIISFMLVIGGALAIFIPYFLVQKENAPKTIPQTETTSKGIMTVDTEEKINLKDINLNRVSSTLKERVEQSSTELGQIKNIFLTEGEGADEKVITSNKFLSLIKADLPPEIERTLRPEYMFGMYNFNGNQEFLILKVGSYDTTFAGMLSWETSLWQDFKEIFNLTDAPATTSASSTNNGFGIEIKKFQDATFFNKDCRVVKDSSEKIIFLYSIIDENTIVITTSTDTLKEILARISKARITTQ